MLSFRPSTGRLKQWVFPAFALLALVVSSDPGHAAKSGEFLNAVVGVEANVPNEARTAQTLGTFREGSGAVISEDGLILTIGYLILEAMSVDVVLQDGRRVGADIVAYDHDTGFGLVRAQETLDVQPLELGDSALLSTGKQALVATRNGPSDAQGAYVVSRRDFAGSWEYLLENAIFTSPPHRGFGGAALLGPDGRLLGIGSLFVANSVAQNKVLPGNMFVPIDQLKPILTELVEKGRRQGPVRPWLGVYPQSVRGHVILDRIARGGPADTAGLRANDLVIAVNGKDVTDVAAFYRALWSSG
ncbi:MAG: S1C family serine protease, partial [Alphaproteobacteria bacterium]